MSYTFHITIMASMWDNSTHPDVFYYDGVPRVTFNKCKILKRWHSQEFYNPATYAYNEWCITLWMYGDGLYRIDLDSNHCRERWRFVRFHIKDLSDLEKVYDLSTREKFHMWEKLNEFIKNLEDELENGT